MKLGVCLIWVARTLRWSAAQGGRVRRHLLPENGSAERGG
jgi:hypothetical protein